MCGQISAGAGITDVTPPSGWLFHRSGGDAKRDRSHHHGAVQPRRRLAAAPDHPGSARSSAWASAGLSHALPGLHA